jgi:hypothetical protein
LASLPRLCSHIGNKTGLLHTNYVCNNPSVVGEPKLVVWRSRLIVQPSGASFSTWSSHQHFIISINMRGTRRAIFEVWFETSKRCLQKVVKQTVDNLQTSCAVERGCSARELESHAKLTESRSRKPQICWSGLMKSSAVKWSQHLIEFPQRSSICNGKCLTFESSQFLGRVFSHSRPLQRGSRGSPLQVAAVATGLSPRSRTPIVCLLTNSTYPNRLPLIILTRSCKIPNANPALAPIFATLAAVGSGNRFQAENNPAVPKPAKTVLTKSLLAPSTSP